MACKILLSTTVSWTSTARHASGFALAGCEVEALAPARAPVTVSRYISRSYVHRSLSVAASLRGAIRKARPDLVVSCDDRAVSNLLRLYESEPAGSEIARVIARSLGKPQQYRSLMARETFLRNADELGIRVPETLPVTSRSALQAAIGAIGLPAVLKADGTWGGEGVSIVRTMEEALAAFSRLANPPGRLRSVARAMRRRDGHWLMSALAPSKRAISIQKFIAGRPAASAFAAWKGEVVSAVCYDVLSADSSIGPPSVIRQIDCAEITRATRLIAQHHGLSGLHGMDFIRDEAGHVHLIEINPRATQGGTLPFGAGRDVPAGLASCVMPTARPRPAIANDAVVFFPGEWVRNPDNTIFQTAYHDVPDDDPMVLQACLKSARAVPPGTVGRSGRNQPGHP
ncbi:MAG: hypothetical protein ACJ8IR_04900 [Alphaproteobacteria bacterium]|jgi:hypothetical protein